MDINERTRTNILPNVHERSRTNETFVRVRSLSLSNGIFCSCSFVKLTERT
ncbi:hypothetical protein HanIR_Chr15g0784251 [Helianthus annuus]|nr:hypothetical protein HanIR_Chr15g0784251 [Helianthus annuus]